MTNKLCILTCRNFAREVAAYVENCGRTDIVVRAFESTCLQPGAQTDDLVRAGQECAHDGLHVALFGGRCLATWPTILAELGSRTSSPKQAVAAPASPGEVIITETFPMRRGASLASVEAAEARVMACVSSVCPYLALNPLIVQHYAAMGAYVATPGWLGAWEDVIAQTGVDRERVRAVLGSDVQRIVLLDTQVYGDLGGRLRAFGDLVGLPVEIMPVGLETIGGYLARILLQFQACCREDRAREDAAHASRRSADYAMIFDLISDLGGLTTEAEVIEKIFEVFTLLCAPSRLLYVPISDGVPGDAKSRPTYLGVSEATKARLAELRNSYAWAESGKGFALRIGRRSQLMAVLEVDGFTYPERKGDYLNLALNIAPVLGLAIANARQFQSLNATNALLAHSNAELEQFAAVISNDLRDPLHTVSHYLEQLVGQYGVQIGVEAGALVAQAAEGTQHMQRLIDDLLAYCRVDAVDRAFALVDCEQVLVQVLRNLSGLIEDTAATVTSDPLPAVAGDATQLVLLFQNLIGNAIKFRGAAPPTVHIRAELQLGDEAATDAQASIGWLFAVQDNGIGIAPALAEQVFGIFRHSPDQQAHSGTGIGLAICKKIVERHGGRIWFESTPGRGSTFYFTIPAQ